EETGVRPKPMVEIGGYPILWHIMKVYSHYGFDDFLILLGYRGYDIKRYFADYFLHRSDVRFDLGANEMTVLDSNAESWQVTLVDTGMDTLTGGRIARARRHLEGERFLLTYGDGVADIDIAESVRHHEECGGIATMTTCLSPGRFGVISLAEGNRVSRFEEKPTADGDRINCGFFVCEPRIFDFLDNRDDLIFEREPMQNLAGMGGLFSYRHEGFWQPMDTLRDKHLLNEMWEAGDAPWKVWE
ncbi:MAG: glucose-1-phosphate cytidylyltransferase, partial [Verrucomicrobiota bacterium]